MSRHDDFRWYTSELHNLFKRYGKCYAVISDRRVVATAEAYGDAVETALSMRARGQVDEFIVQEIGPDESAYTAFA